MSIPYNDNLTWTSYYDEETWPIDTLEQEVTEPRNRAEQFLRDLARLVLKVPFRAIFVDQAFMPDNWAGRERCAINAKLTGYSFVQMLFVPVKWMVAIAEIFTAAIGWQNASDWLNDTRNTFEGYTAYLDGCASRLEALKEEGAKVIGLREGYEAYKEWLYSIDPLICRQPKGQAT